MDGAVAVSLTNLSHRPRTLTIARDHLELNDYTEILDAWTHEPQPTAPTITMRLPAHGSRLVVTRPEI